MEWRTQGLGLRHLSKDRLVDLYSHFVLGPRGRTVESSVGAQAHYQEEDKYSGSPHTTQPG